MKEFDIMAYEWIDNLNFTLNPNDCINNADEYISIVKQIFIEDGWDGDGDIQLMWVPPFMLKQGKQWAFTKGIAVWHVKQLEDGTSWILYPKELFENDDKTNK
ncbi:hypothetical protein LWM68_39940 [Niabella sp. W65]|nr:hypothetical protein [Niabella sp. W65]MCH7368368.1 hypothetical protein [Niabella sp. W65]ULT43966.1 hypothetical protein KRR40_11620 [Niabella sp. I65]